MLRLLGQQPAYVLSELLKLQCALYEHRAGSGRPGCGAEDATSNGMMNERNAILIYDSQRKIIPSSVLGRC